MSRGDTMALVVFVLLFGAVIGVGAFVIAAGDPPVDAAALCNQQLNGSGWNGSTLHMDLANGKATVQCVREGVNRTIGVSVDVGVMG